MNTKLNLLYSKAKETSIVKLSLKQKAYIKMYSSQNRNMTQSYFHNWQYSNTHGFKSIKTSYHL